jgi:hypothetical protein
MQDISARSCTLLKQHAARLLSLQGYYKFDVLNNNLICALDKGQILCLTDCADMADDAAVQYP